MEKQLPLERGRRLLPGPAGAQQTGVTQEGISKAGEWRRWISKAQELPLGLVRRLSGSFLGISVDFYFEARGQSTECQSRKLGVQGLAGRTEMSRRKGGRNEGRGFCRGLDGVQ